MNNIMKSKNKILLFIVCMIIFAVSLIYVVFKTDNFKEKLKSDLERTSTVIFYCDIDGASIKVPLTQFEKEQVIEILSNGNMEPTFENNKAFPVYWFQTNEYEMGFVPDVEITVEKDKNIHRYIPDKNLNFKLNQFCQKLIGRL